MKQNRIMQVLAIFLVLLIIIFVSCSSNKRISSLSKVYSSYPRIITFYTSDINADNRIFESCGYESVVEITDVYEFIKFAVDTVYNTGAFSELNLVFSVSGSDGRIDSLFSDSSKYYKAWIRSCWVYAKVAENEIKQQALKDIWLDIMFGGLNFRDNLYTDTIFLSCNYCRVTSVIKIRLQDNKTIDLENTI